MSEIDHHLFKFKDALLNTQRDETMQRGLITEYAADLGNYLMKSIELFGLNKNS